MRRTETAAGDCYRRPEAAGAITVAADGTIYLVDAERLKTSARARSLPISFGRHQPQECKTCRSECWGNTSGWTCLGTGASGIVYLAKDTLLGRLVALKEISAQGEEKERVLGEARVLDRLRHPNIVQVVGVDEIGGKVVIAMEYVRGRSLLEILRQTPTLPFSEAASIVAQVCDGLAFAHAHRTVHRDVKPANILVGEDGVVKLVDFGLAEVLGTHSLAGGAGTYAYMAPEDFHEEEQSGRQSDIWAVGVVLYEVLAGRRPFQVPRAKDPFAWKRAIEDDPLLPLTASRPDVPPVLERIVAHALTRDCTLRYADASEMARDLRSLVLPAASGPAESIPRPMAAPKLPDFPPVSDIDGFLTVAPDHWETTRIHLREGTLTDWLQGIGETPLAEVAAEIAAEEDRDGDDQLRDFLYRAGMETAHEARRAFAEGERAGLRGQAEEAVRLLTRAVHLDPTYAIYHQKLALALRTAGDSSGADQILETAPAEDRQANPAGQITLDPERVDFGTLRSGQVRSVRVLLRSAGRGVFQGRVLSAPPWVRVDPPAFSTRQRQPLMLTLDTAALWPPGLYPPPAPAAFEDAVVLDLGGERRRLPVLANVLPIQRGFWNVVFWYMPLLFCCLLPMLAGLAAPGLAQLNGTTHNHLHQLHNLWQPGFVASGLLCGALFVLASSADTIWPLRALPLGLLCLLIGRFAAVAPLLGSPREELARTALVQTAIPILMLLTLQTVASAVDPHRWGRWQVWRWIAGATALFVAYALLHIG